ncbi:lipoprotein [Rickettsiales bacterium LUAb2]
MRKIILLLLISLFLSGCSSSLLLNTTKNNHIEIDKNKFTFATDYSSSKVKNLKLKLNENHNNLILLSRNDVLNLIGNPIIIKDTKVITIWQYRKSCILNIIWQKNNTEQETNENLSLEIGNDVHNDDFNNQQSQETNEAKDNYSIAWIDAIDDNKNSTDAFNCFASILN